MVAGAKKASRAKQVGKRCPGALYLKRVDQRAEPIDRRLEETRRPSHEC